LDGAPSRVGEMRGAGEPWLSQETKGYGVRMSMLAIES
jgi:hypothetical protein